MHFHARKDFPQFPGSVLGMGDSWWGSWRKGGRKWRKGEVTLPGNCAVAIVPAISYSPASWPRRRLFRFLPPNRIGVHIQVSRLLLIWMSKALLDPLLGFLTSPILIPFQLWIWKISLHKPEWLLRVTTIRRPVLGNKWLIAFFYMFYINSLILILTLLY